MGAVKWRAALPLIAVLLGLCWAAGSRSLRGDTPRDGTRLPSSSQVAAPRSVASAGVREWAFADAAAADAASVGPGRCSARACHGSIEPPRDPVIWKTAYTTWVTRDSHARAYEVLFNERSDRIAKNLAGSARDDAEAGTSTRYTPAHQDTRCLACHAFSTSPPGGHPAAAADLEGVSCEACHGPAERWLVPHTARSWKSKSPEVKEREYGMTPLDDVARRAEACAACHVGAPAQGGVAERDAYHDIMAAGHPRLNFELTTFLAQMPRHWTEKDHGADFEVRLWAAGQLATARSALRLLESRVRAAGDKSTAPPGKRPWPEFAEYGCFACHHDLAEPSWRQQRGYADRKPGSFPWATWFLPMTRLLAEQDPEQNRALLVELDALEQLMSVPYPDAAEAAARAHSAAELLRAASGRAASRRYDDNTVRALVAACAAAAPRLVASGWDAATQLYLALVALTQGQGDRPMAQALEVLYEALKFPDGYDSPSEFGHEPTAERAADFLRQLRDLGRDR
jgi:hypothetical protein